MSEKVLVIGLDGATFDIILPLVKEGKLPNFEKFIKNGVYGGFNTVIPYLTPPGWTSIVTGVNPGKHGIFDFMIKSREDYQMEVVGSNLRKCNAIWDILNYHGKKVGIVNLPGTYPPEKVEGFVVSGLLTPSEESDFTYPKGLKKEIEKFKYKIDTKNYFVEKDKDILLEDIFEVANRRFETTKFLLRTKEWNFFILVFIGTDKIQHLFWRFMDDGHPRHERNKFSKAIEDYHMELDKMVGEFVEMSDENTTIFIISDHGFGSLNKFIYLNRYLKDLGLYKTIKYRVFLKKFLLKLGISKHSIYEFLQKLGIKETSFIPQKIKDLPPDEFRHDTQVDWKKTKAYLLTGSEKCVNINLEGRDFKGCVKSDEYENLRDYIIEKLYELKDPETGVRVIERVYKREEIYHGDWVENARDLLVITKDGYFLRPELFDEAVSEKANYDISGCHRKRGIFMCFGKDIKKGFEIEDVSVLDFMPTVLHLMNIPLPKDLDGRILKEIFGDMSEPKKRVEKYMDYKKRKSHIRKVIEEDEDLVKDRLKGLGYLD